jgi:hypothetical protein
MIDADNVPSEFSEKHKIIPTILSRCQIFDFNRIQVKDISSHLESIAKKENIDYELQQIIEDNCGDDGLLEDVIEGDADNKKICTPNSINDGKTSCRNYPLANFTAFGSTEADILCAKKKWAKDCNIHWDGVTNNSQACLKTTI